MAFPGSGQRQQKGRWISMVHAISCSPSGIVIKEILLSHKLASVCCEGISISGNFYINKGKAFRVCCPTRPNETKLPGPPRGVWWDPDDLWEENMYDNSCCPEGYASEVYMKICLPGVPWGWLKVPVSDNHPYGEAKGEGQGSLWKKKNGNKVKRTWKENQQICQGPQEPWTLRLSSINW